jgi:hypothetical protein
VTEECRQADRGNGAASIDKKTHFHDRASKRTVPFTPGRLYCAMGIRKRMTF